MAWWIYFIGFVVLIYLWRIGALQPFGEALSWVKTQVYSAYNNAYDPANHISGMTPEQAKSVVHPHGDNSQYTTHADIPASTQELQTRSQGRETYKESLRQQSGLTARYNTSGITRPVL